MFLSQLLLHYPFWSIFSSISTSNANCWVEVWPEYLASRDLSLLLELLLETEHLTLIRKREPITEATAWLS